MYKQAVKSGLASGFLPQQATNPIQHCASYLSNLQNLWIPGQGGAALLDRGWQRPVREGLCRDERRGLVPQRGNGKSDQDPDSGWRQLRKECLLSSHVGYFVLNFDDFLH